MKPTKQHILSAICLQILLVPNIACMTMSSDLTYSWAKEIGYLAVVLFLLLLPMTFLKRRTYFIAEGVLGLLWMPVELSSLYLNRMTTSHYFIGIVMETNWIEAREVLVSVWPLVVVMVLIWAVYITMVFHMKNEWMLTMPFRKLTWIGVPLMIVVGMAGSYFLLPKGRGNILETLNVTSRKLAMKFYKIYPYDIYLVSRQYIQEKKHLDDLSKELENFRFGITPKTDDNEEHYILVIGEAARYDHFHINGYNRDTSPSLDVTTNLFSLSSLYSNANLTHNVFPIMLTRADILHTDRGAAERSIAEAYQEGGFQTAWLSSQPMMVYSTRIALEMDYHKAAISGLDGGSAEPDSVLCDWTAELFDHHPAQKSFYVLHMLGSHLKYDQRYPKEYEFFKPAIQASDGYSVLSVNNKDKVVNAYDNTIRYTDHVLGRLIDLLRKQNGIRALIYVSDHGENLFDDEREYSVHGTYEGTEYEAHAPCFIWLSEEYKAAYPEKVKALEQNLHKQVQSDVLFYSLADMGGLREIVVPEKSFFSPELQPQDTIRMITGNGEVKVMMLENKY